MSNRSHAEVAFTGGYIFSDDDHTNSLSLLFNAKNQTAYKRAERNFLQQMTAENGDEEDDTDDPSLATGWAGG